MPSDRMQLQRIPVVPHHKLGCYVFKGFSGFPNDFTLDTYLVGNVAWVLHVCLVFRFMSRSVSIDLLEDKC